jgi:glycerol-3-phosphate cytidylyltransferase
MHPGHIMMLEEAKNVCEFLVVGVQSDPSVDRPGKNKPVQTHEERLIMVGAIRYVDEVVSYDTEDDLLLLLREVYPDIRIIGSDHKGKEFTGHELPIKVHFNSRDHEWSTTNLRKQVYESEKAMIDWNEARR